MPVPRGRRSSGSAPAQCSRCRPSAIAVRSCPSGLRISCWRQRLRSQSASSSRQRCSRPISCCATPRFCTPLRGRGGPRFLPDLWALSRRNSGSSPSPSRPRPTCARWRWSRCCSRKASHDSYSSNRPPGARASASCLWLSVSRYWCGRTSSLPSSRLRGDDSREADDQSVPLIRQRRERVEFDAFFGKFCCFLGSSHTVDRAVIDFPIVHLACFLGELRADIVGILGEMVAQLLELGPELLFLWRNHCHRRRCWCRRRLGRCRRRLDGRALLFCGGGQPRRHDRFFHLGRAALRTGHETALGLLVVGGRILKPALKLVALLADECVANHSALRTTWRCAGSASGSTISKRRPCCSDGIRARALATSAGLISAMMTPGSVPPSAMMLPQGSTISEWP